jgi:hypothetical protein
VYSPANLTARKYRVFQESLGPRRSTLLRDRALRVPPEYHIVKERERERDRAFPYYSSLLQESALTKCNNLLHVKAAEISNKLH